MKIIKNHDGARTVWDIVDMSVDDVDFLIEAIHEKPCKRCGWDSCSAKDNLCKDWLDALQDAKGEDTDENQPER